MTFVTNTSSINFYTSVLGGQDYRFGLDNALVLNDVPCTNFQCNALPLQPIPNDINNFLTDHFIATQNFVFPNWTSTNGDTFVTSIVATPISVARNQFNFTYITSNGTPLVGTPFGGATPIINYIFALVWVDNIAGIIISYNGSPILRTDGASFISDGASIPFTNGANYPYLVYCDFILHQLWVIDLYTRVSNGLVMAGTIPTPSNAIQILDTTSTKGVIDIASYFNCNNIPNVLQYFYNTYGGLFPLPLTFPQNAVSVTN